MPKADVTRGGSTLTLSDVTRHHAGVYRCTASNGVGQDAVEEIHLQILCELKGYCAISLLAFYLVYTTI